MPVFDNSKAIYVNLYKELTNKHTPINVYLTGGGSLNKGEKAVGIAIRQFVRRFEMSYETLTTKDGKSPFGDGTINRNDVDYETAKKNMADEERLFGELERDIQEIRAALLTSARHKQRDDINHSENNAAAAQLLSDALRYHKEMKEDADQRREYVKLINDQHQAYAIWKEQIVKEVTHYKEVLKYCSPETRKRFNDEMEKYNSMDAMLAGARKWFENEYKNFREQKGHDLETAKNKVKKLQEKKLLLDRLVKDQTIPAEEVEKARKLKKELEEKQAAYILFCFMYEHEKKELEQKRIELEKLWLEQDEQYKSEEEHSKDFIKDYQYLENGFVKGNIITERKMDDMTKFKTNLVSKLTEDTDKQRAHIREKQSRRCDAIHKELEQFRQELAKLSQPKGSAKSKNSREFDLFKYKIRSYLDTMIKVVDEDNPGTTRDEKNMKCIYIDLDLIRDQKSMNLSDEKRIECMKNIRNMMEAIGEAADTYLKSQEGLNRETELDSARYNTVSKISMYARKCKLEFVCMMLEERFCTDAPNLNLVQAKSGIEKTDYTKAEAFKKMSHEQQYKQKPEVNGPEIAPK